jgi:hypothetical protein
VHEAEERRALLARLAGVDRRRALAPATCYGLATASANLGAEPDRSRRYVSNWVFSGQVSAELDSLMRNLQT